MQTNSILIAFLLITSFATTNLAVQADDIDESVLIPEQVSDQTFAALMTASPFRRIVALSDSLILTGIARIDDELIATLYDTENRELHMVSKQTNPDGWLLVDVRGNESELDTLTAKIQIGGGEVVPIRYEKLPPGARKVKQVSRPIVRLSSAHSDEAKRLAVNFKHGSSFDGYGKVPGEVLKKLSQLSVQQRESINRQMIDLRNKGMGSSDRRKIYDQKINEALSRRRR